MFQGPRSYLMSGRNIPVVQAVDLNHDGKLDLVALDTEADAAAVLLGMVMAPFRRHDSIRSTANMPLVSV